MDLNYLGYDEIYRIEVTRTVSSGGDCEHGNELSGSLKTHHWSSD
jgi:hypothetical protein